MTTRNLDYLEVGPAWTGDVWKTIKVLIERRPDLDIKILDADRTGLAVVKNLDPRSTLLKECYDEVLTEYQNMELEKVGARAYYDIFPLQSSADFLASRAI